MVTGQHRRPQEQRRRNNKGRFVESDKTESHAIKLRFLTAPNQECNGVVAVEGGGSELGERGLQGESRWDFLFLRDRRVWEEKFFVTA